MKSTIAVLISLFVLASSDVPCVYRESTKMITGDVSGPYEKYNASDSDVKFYFMSKNNPNGIGPLDLSDSAQVASVGFSADKGTIFVVHGWHNDHSSDVCTLVPKALIQTQDVNVFIVDWSSIARGLYIKAYSAVPDVGRILAKNIQNLVSSSGLNLDRTGIVGHSLGAHVSGIAGQTIGGRVDHIVGLDPALPCFSYDDVNGRLDATDAKYVEVIHTCAGKLGFDVDLGHSDYYPNGGKDQPGCSVVDVTGSCSHGRSYEYYAESILTSGFVAQKCNSYRSFKDNECNGPKANMGEYELDRSAVGAYYLDTNASPPYAKH